MMTYEKAEAWLDDEITKTMDEYNSIPDEEQPRYPKIARFGRDYYSSGPNEAREKEIRRRMWLDRPVPPTLPDDGSPEDDPPDPSPLAGSASVLSFVKITAIGYDSMDIAPNFKPYRQAACLTPAEALRP